MAPRSALRALALVSCLATSQALSIERRAGVIPSTLPGSWQSMGCYVDVAGRTLTGPNTAGNTVTVESCIAFCSNAGYIYAGTEYSDECYCGASLATGSGPAPTSDCSMTCAGNGTEACGGPNRLNLFWSGTTGPQTNPGNGNWTFSGCYTEGTTGRTLTYGATTTGGSGALTVDLCLASCKAAGYDLAGVEYSGECYCDNSIHNGGALAPEGLAGCNMLCNGNLSEFCGGSGRLNVYDYNKLVSLPPYTTVSSTTASSATSSSVKVTTSSTSVPVVPTTSPSSTHGPGSTSSSVVQTSSTSPPNNAVSPTSSSSTASASPTLGIKQVVGQYTYVGCQTEATTGRALSAVSFYDYNTMTLEECAQVCNTDGPYTYFGVEYGGECYCGNTLAAGSVPAPASQCSFICPGSKYEYCGAGNRLELYILSSHVTQSSSVVSSVASSSSSSHSSVVGVPTTSSSTVATVPSSSQPATSSPVSTSSSVATSTVRPSTSSTMTSSLASVSPTLGITPTVAGYSFQGCYTEGTNARALSGASFFDYTAMTLEECAQSCNGWTYFGVEYGGECYCGSSLAPGSVYDPVQSDCSFVCPGNKFEYCGSGNHLQLYKLGTSTLTTSATTATGTRSSTSVSTGSSTKTSVTSSSTTSTGPVSTASGWAFRGCYVDGLNGRILNHQFNDNQALTQESCVAACQAAGYTIAGMEFSVQCFCDNALYNGAALATDQTTCNDPCSGNKNEMCGGGNRMTLWSNGVPQVYQPPAAQTTGLPANWVYKGCLQDNIPSAEDPNEMVPTFPYMVWNNASNDPVACITQCQKFGFNAAGLEYGSECFCGDVQNIQVASWPGTSTDPGATQTYTRSRVPQIVADSQCNSVCSGNGQALCGAGNLMSYYAWEGPEPLYTFGFPTGDAAGEYSLLIGGVVVPLMTGVAVNGKVTFTEKYGTGEPNGTGAYELDLTQLDNFSAAWRTMSGMDTDVFCSAGLTLPDKAGRQITVGGWAGQSNFGVRTYWPDGSAGVKGTNEWQEDPGVVSLQVPRWYPSAMVMANGSIMIIGGEIGDNDVEQPNLELLPPTGVPDDSTANGWSNTTKYLDFLDRTQPFNLYPFVAVCPSGIFIAYYNEARILDDVTFDTKIVLPNMPAAVNDDTGGRTYQLEGAMSLLPQHYPYTDNLGVLICGGSTQGGGYAIDNCISMRPEDPNPTWTIERMPSRRVMPCMAGLPDGTYVIVNGGQHGVAGFGLGGDPNYNAVLYDPTLPVNARMSIMANTTVARLYHSEAITLLDGRVMISGSDPTGDYAQPTGEWPEEYRVEVFTPPNLMGNPTRPTFTMANTDWDYNEVIDITVTSGTCNFVSMLGSVVSTHGNAMGQRTIFPGFSCAGNSCKITAPPDAHHAPPGWFMVFCLQGTKTSGSIPSIGQFIRIGKDPAKVGEWPANVAAFQPLPGV